MASDIEFDGELISATLLNSLNEITSVKEGDQITLRKDQIEDWMYVLEGRVYGGFTIQVLRARMSSDERRGHDGAWGFTFADPNHVDLAPNSRDPDAEHPMSENMADGLAEAIGKRREAFFALGGAGLNTLHSLALGGSLACVRVLLEAGADPHAKTRSGKTALELATMMGWPRVAELLRNAKAVG